MATGKKEGVGSNTVIFSLDLSIYIVSEASSRTRITRPFCDSKSAGSFSRCIDYTGGGTMVGERVDVFRKNFTRFFLRLAVRPRRSRWHHGSIRQQKLPRSSPRCSPLKNCSTVLWTTF